MSPLVIFSKIFLILGILGASRGYDLGVRYSYKYHTQVSPAEDCQSYPESHFKNVGFQLAAQVYITSIWENEQNKEEKLLKIEFVKPSLLVPKKSTYTVHDSKLDSISKSPLYVEWINGEIKRVLGDATEDPNSKNLKKGVASLLQVSSLDVQKDVTGDCLVEVKADGRLIKKKKTNCFHPAAAKRNYKSLEIRSAKVTSFSETTIELVAQKSNFVLSAEGTDIFRMQSNMWKKPTICVHSKTSLSLESENSGAQTVSGKSFNEAAEESVKSSDVKFKEETLTADVTPKTCGDRCKNLPKIISGYKESLSAKNLAKLKSASSFLKLLEVFRLASEEEILSPLKSKKFKPILPQLIDVTAYSSLPAAIQAMELFSADSDLIERLLLSLCTSSNPDVELLERILGKLKKGEKNKKIHDTLVVALGALTKSYARRHKELSSEKVVQATQEFFTQKLNLCSDPECQLVYLRGLRNAALSSSLPLLLEYTEKGGKPALEALLALQSISQQNLDSKVVKILQEVFHQTKKKQISSSRAIAAALLLKTKPSEEIIRNIFDELRNPENSEFTTFVASKIYNIVENDEKLRSAVKAILAAEGVKYHSLFLKGSSASFTKPLMTTSFGVNTTYGLEMEMLPGGSLKRSSFDVNVIAPEGNLHVLTVGMYAEGLASLGGSGESVETEEVDTTAGLELTVLGVALRPYVLFKSTSELMGLVWNGAGSKPTPAVQGNFLIADDSTTLTLQNGLLVDFDLRGVLSADLSAFVEISIWYKTSHAVVNNAAALLVKGSAHIDTRFISQEEEFTFTGESAISFITDSDFSDVPYKMCLQMVQPEFQFRYNILATEHVPRSKYDVKVIKKRKVHVPAQSFLLHQDNNDQCASLLSS